MWIYEQTKPEENLSLLPQTVSLPVQKAEPALPTVPETAPEPVEQLPSKEPCIPAKRHATRDCWLLAAAFLLGSSAAGVLQAVCDARQAELLATQAAILDTAAALLKAGGRLVYSTYTIDPAENQQQIAAFLQRHPEFEVCAPDVPLPAGMTAGEHGCLSVPTRTGMDGFFLCVLQKAAATQ